MRVVDAAAPLQRRRVMRRLENAANRQIALIVAAAGCGKSVALSQYLQSCGEQWVRFDVRPEHARLLGFARGLAEAFGAIAPSARLGVGEAVQAALHAEQCAPALARWFANQVPFYEGIVAIDDLHLTSDDTVCADFLAALIELLKPRVRWILCTRSAEHLPLARWVVYGDADVPVSEEELKFTDDEALDAAALVNSHLGAHEIRHLLEVTGGWPTAFHLALRVSEVSPDMQRVTTAARELSYRFLAENVYRALNGQERAMLEFGSILSEIDVDVMERAGFAQVRPTLERVAARLSIVAPVSAEAAQPFPRRYRCHDLFRDFLRRQVAVAGPDHERTLLCSAANALQRCDRPAEALRLFAQARSRNDILRVLRQHGFFFGQQAYGDIVALAIDALDEEDRRSHPLVVGIRGQFEITAGHYQAGESLLEHAVECCEGDPDLRGILLAKLSACRFNLQKQPLPELLTSATDPALDRHVRAELLSVWVISEARFGRFEGLEPLLDELQVLCDRLDSDVLRAMLLYRIGVATYFMGDVQRGRVVFPPAAQLSLRLGMYRAATFIYLTMGSSALLNEDEPLRAMENMELAALAAAQCGEPHHIVQAQLGQLDATSFIGDAQELQRLYDSVHIPQGEFAGDDGTMLKTAALLAALRGEWSDAARTMRSASETSKFPEYRMLGTALSELFRAFAGTDSEGDPVAEVAAERSSAPLDRSAVLRFAALSNAVLAVAALLRDRKQIGERLLRDDPGALTPATAAVWEAARALIAGAAFTPQRAATLRELGYGLFAYLLATASELLARGESAAGLTPTERAILRALDAGKSPKEIAAETNASVNTVRWHIRQVIAKFNCSGRDQALRIARARGLL